MEIFMDRKYFDDFGLLVQNPGFDGGDTACEHSAYQLGLIWTGKKDTLGRGPKTLWAYTMAYLVNRDQKDLIRRHPDPEMWYSDWDRATGDQWQNIIILAGEMNDRKLLLKFLFGFIKRFWFCTNTFRRNYWRDKHEHEAKAPHYKEWPENEIYLRTIPDFRPFFLGLFIRAFNFWPLYPVLLVTDFCDLFAGSVGFYFGGKKVEQGNDLNYIIKTLQAERRLPTFFSRLARGIYKRRPYVRRERYLSDLPSPPQTALDWHCKEPNPPLNELFKPLIKSWY